VGQVVALLVGGEVFDDVFAGWEAALGVVSHGGIIQPGS
jgi:hypothetical protein